MASLSAPQPNIFTPWSLWSSTEVGPLYFSHAWQHGNVFRLDESMALFFMDLLLMLCQEMWKNKTDTMLAESSVKLWTQIWTEHVTVSERSTEPDHFPLFFKNSSSVLSWEHFPINKNRLSFYFFSVQHWNKIFKNNVLLKKH